MKKAFIILIFLSVGMSHAQNYKFGKVSTAELKQVEHPIDKEAVAAVLYKNVHTKIIFRDGFKVLTNVHYRIKIYNKEGFKWATQRIKLYHQDGYREEIGDLKGCTYFFKDGEVIKRKLDNRNVDEEDEGPFVRYKVLTLPEVQAGCVVEVKYKFISPFLDQISAFKYQHEIPVDKYDFHFEAPEFYFYKEHFKGEVTPKIERYVETERISWSNFHRTGGNIRQVAETKITNTEIQVNMNIAEFTLENVPAIKKVDYVHHMDNYRSAITYELASVKFPNRPWEKISDNWEQTILDLYEHRFFGEELRKSNYFEQTIDSLLGPNLDSLERIQAILSYVSKNIKWNGLDGKHTQNGVKKAFQTHIGNVADINLMLCAMLRYSGMVANPVLISTVENGIPFFKSDNIYNYIIVAVETEGQTLLLDATSDIGCVNVLPLRDLNFFGRIIYADGNSKEIQLNPIKRSLNLQSFSVKMEGDGVVKGLQSCKLTDYESMCFKSKCQGVNEISITRLMKKSNPGIKIDSLKFEDNTGLNNSLVLTNNFTFKNQFETLDNQVYFYPLFFTKQNKSPYEETIRKLPIELSYPSTNKVIFNISIPDGYIIEKMPKPLILTLPDGIGKYKYLITATQQGLTVMVSKTFKVDFIESSYYEILQEFYAQILAQENQQVILKMVSPVLN